MKARIATISASLLFGFALIAGAGTAMAGDGKSCGGKKKGESAAVEFPMSPRT